MCHVEVTPHGEIEWLYEFSQCLGDRTLNRVHIHLSLKIIVCVNECETVFDVMRREIKRSILPSD